MLFKVIGFLFLIVGFVYSVTDSEYHRMPDLFGLDDYDSCLQQDKGVYCVASFELFADHGNDLIKLIKDHSNDFKHFNYSYIDRGICITNTCKHYMNKINVNETLDLKETLEECFNEILWNDYKINATVGNVYYCDRHGERVQLDATDWAVAGLLTVILALSVIGSYYDVKIRKKSDNKVNENKYLLCFSVFRNLQALTSNQNELKLETLRELYGVRVVFLALIVFAHMAISLGVYIKNPQNLEEAFNIEPYYLIFNGTMVVQIFFFLSGFMLTYFLQVQAEKFTVKWSTIPKIIVMRWFRLTPVCVVMVAVMASWVRHIGSGPLWNLAVTLGPTAQCRSYWWSYLLYINNMIPDNKVCMGQTWHIAADMQMFILGLIVHVATRNGGRTLALSVLLVLGMLAPAVPVWLYGYDAYHMSTLEFVRTISHKTSETFHYVHIRGYMNLPCFVLGMATGYLGHHLQNRGVDLSKQKTLSYLSWLVIIIMTAIIYIGRFFYDHQRVSVLARVGYAMTHRAALGFFCSVWMLLLICRCNDASRVMFAWRGWAILGKLYYCVYIVHFIFLHLFLGFRKELLFASFFEMIPITVAVLVVSYTVALPMYLMIEAPFYKLIRTIGENRGRQEKKNI